MKTLKKALEDKKKKKNEKIENEYIPFGKEWQAEMMKWNKQQLVERIKTLSMRVKELEEKVSE